MTGGFVRGAMLVALLSLLPAGCVSDPSPKPSIPSALNGEAPARRLERDVIQHVLRSSVQVVLERNGERYRTGSGVVIVAKPSATGSECFVLSSGHTFAGLKAGQDGDGEIYVLFDRHQGAAVKVRAQLVARGA